MLIRAFVVSLRMLVVLSVLTGVLYPALITGCAQLAFRHRANGSLIERDGRCVGSEFIGQEFTSPRYFWGRPSSTSARPYDAANSIGSNLGPLNPTLRADIEARVNAFAASDPMKTAPIPVDLVTSSASGLDPHISPAAAEWQVPRVARERAVTELRVRELVAAHTDGKLFGLFGRERVAVLELNLALDGLR